MPKKKINNRLNKLFEDIKSDEPPAQPKRAAKRPYQTARLNPDSIPTDLAQPRTAHEVSASAAASSVQKSDAAVLSLAFQSRENDWATLRILDESTNSRVWSEDDQLLVRQVTDQLSLALENAHLFQETQQRAAELNILNEMAIALSAETDIAQISEIAYKFTSKLLDTTYYYLAVCDEKTGEISFPLTVNNNQRFQNPARKIGSGGLTDYILRSKENLFIPDNFATRMKELGIEMMLMADNPTPLCWLGVPLLTGNRAVGAIAVQSVERPFVYSDRDRDLLLSVANQVATALENANLFREQQKQAAELQDVSEISSAVSTILNPQELLDTFVYLTRQRYNLYHTHIFILEEDNHTLDVKACGWQDENLNGTQETRTIDINQPVSIVARAARTLQPVILNNVRENPTWLPNPDLPDVQSEMAIPVISQEKLLIGVLNIHADQLNAFDDNDSAIMTTLAAQIGAAIQNTRLFQETRKKTGELVKLNEIVRAISEQIELKDVLNTAYQQITKLLPMDAFFIALYDEASKMVSYPIVVDDGKFYEEPDSPLNPENFTGKTILAGKVFSENIKPEDMGNQAADDTRLGNVVKGYGAVLFLPLRSGSKTMGCISIQSYDFFAYKQDDIALLENIANQVSIGIQNARLYNDSKRKNEELAVLNALSKELTKLLSLNEISELAYKYTSQLMDASSFFICLINHEKQEVACPLFYEDGEKMEVSPRKLGNGFSDYVLRTNRTLFMPDHVTERMEEMGFEKLLIGSPAPAKSWLGVPMSIGDRVLGAVVVQSIHQENLHTEHHRDLLLTIAQQTAVALENSRLFELSQTSEASARKSNEELAVLNGLSSELAKLSGINDISESAFKYTSQLMDTKNFFICLLDEEKQEISFPLFIGDGEKAKVPPRNLGNGLTEHVMRTNQTLLLPDHIDERTQQLGIDIVVIGSHADASCWLGVPLSIGSRVLGAIVVQSIDQENLYNEHQRDLLLTIAQQTAVAFDNSRLFELSQASEANFRNLIENAPEAIIVVDMTTGLIADPNENAERLYGFNRQELVQMSLADLSPELQTDGRPSKDAALEKLTETLEGSTPIFEWTHMNRQGKMLPCEIHLARLPGDHPRVRATVIDITERKSNELIRTASTAISDAALNAPDIESLLKAVHDSVNTLVPAKNFYVSLYDKESDHLTFPYLVDEYAESWPPQKLGKGLTSYVMKTGKPLLVTPEILKEITSSPDFQPIGIGPLDWIGVPLKSGRDLLGVMAIQTYSPDIRLTGKDRDTLNLLGNQVAIAIGRRKTQESITRSEAELRALFSAMNDVIIVLDRDGKYMRIAPTNPSRLFRPSEEMIGKTVKEILPAYIQEPMMSAIQEALTTGLPVQLEYWLDIEGQTYWFDAKFSRLSEDQVFLVAKDISERKKAEGTLRRRDEYLAASSEIGRKITSTLDLETIFARAVNLVSEQFSLYHTAIYTVEETGFNAILRNGTGAAGQEMKKQKHKLPIKPNTLIGSVISMGEAVIITDTAASAVYPPNPLLPETRSEAGIPLRVGSRVTGVLDLQSDHPNAFQPDDIAVLQTLADQIAIAIDNARSYELSQQAVREMREIDRLKSQFLANMSHELRTPLNSIIGFSRVIIKGIDGPVTELQQQDLTAIYNSGQHLLALINDILDLAKIEAGKMELAFDEVNMNDVINSVLATVTGLIKDKPVTIKKNIAPDMPTVRADAIRIRQVLINLFSNASKFTDEGTITITASVGVGENSRPEITVSVADTGPGIAPEDQAKLFQAFSQVDDSPTRKTGGTGLGLSISQNLIQMHGGRIGVDSVVGKGSTFYFTLPVYRGNPSSNEPQSNMGGKTILAIDDDPQVIRLYERYLQPQGYQVIAVTEPGRAKERAIQLKPFAITLDIMMPGIDGWQVLSELKSSPETRNIPVVICSIIEDHEKGFSLGAAGYLSKPILEEDLLSALESLNKDNLIEEILVIDDNPNDLKLIGTMLKNQGRYKTSLVEGGVNGWNAITKKTPQAVILDLFMPVLDGFTILENMRADIRLRDVPVIILTAGDLTADQKHQLAEFGPRLIAKNALNEKDLIASIERALQRAAK